MGQETEEPKEAKKHIGQTYVQEDHEISDQWSFWDIKKT
jgi:hypothetical protein